MNKEINKMAGKILIRQIIDFCMLMIWVVGISHLFAHHFIGCIIAFIIIGFLSIPRSFVESANEKEYERLCQEEWEQWKNDVMEIFKNRKNEE